MTMKFKCSEFLPVLNKNLGKIYTVSQTEDKLKVPASETPLIL